MKIAFLINSLASSKPVDTTAHLGMSAANRGHEVYYFEVGDGIFNANGALTALAVKLKGNYKNINDFLVDVKGENVKKVKVTSEELDVIYLRNNPADDINRPWAKFSGILFGQFAVKQGVLVLNHPDTLAYAHVDKMYFEHFPEAIRPASIITRDIAEIESFYKDQKFKMILKPLEGSGGKDVFLVNKKESNLKQIVEAISRNGYVIAQEYLPEAKNGDIRMFMMNGRPMMYKGKYAAFRRRPGGDDIRSNMHAGGKAEAFKMTDRVLEIAEILKPKFIQDGIFCAGLDIVGDKLIELNITSPGGLHAVSHLEGVNFNDAMIMSIEKKLEYKKYYGSELSNIELAVME